MARPTLPRAIQSVQAEPNPMQFAQVSGNAVSGVPKAASMASSTAFFRSGRRPNPKTDRYGIAKEWQVEAYRHINICGEARYSATLFAALASRAEIGVSEPNALSRKAVWVTSGPEVDALAELAPTVRERTKLIRDYMLHRTIAGECYLIARDRVDTDPGYIEPPDAGQIDPADIIDRTDYVDPNTPIWEIVAVTEIQRVGETWRVRHDNGNYIDLHPDDPVIRMWNPDPENRREAWSPFRSLLPTLREIEWLTMHIFSQVKSRLMSAGVWFLPNNLTFAPPPPDAVEGGEETIAQMNEAEQFMVSLAESSMAMLDPDEVSFPSVVMAEAEALSAIDQTKLIKFWSDIDDKAMLLRTDAVRRFALGMDLPPEQVIGSSGIAVTGSSGGSGAINHWGVWANEEQTIVAHIEPALDDFTSVLTYAVIRRAVDNSDKVIGYDTASLRLRQDRSKEAVELYDRGLLSGEVTLREVGFDPEHDKMSDEEFRRWLLVRITGGSATPEQVQAALKLLNVALPVEMPPAGAPSTLPAPRKPGRTAPPSLQDHPYEGPPRVQHDQTPAPYAIEAPKKAVYVEVTDAVVASCEVLVLRALEKAGNRLLNDGKRGRDRDRTTPPHMAHLTASHETEFEAGDFDLTLAATVFSDRPALERAIIESRLARYCANLYANREAYTHDGLVEAVCGL